LDRLPQKRVTPLFFYNIFRNTEYAQILPFSSAFVREMIGSAARCRILCRRLLECGRSSYRLPISPHTTIVLSRDAKTVAAATAGASRISSSVASRKLMGVCVEGLRLSDPIASTLVFAHKGAPGKAEKL
jgi:hypothetical protein